jgi:hypothetical protein
MASWYPDQLGIGRGSVLTIVSRLALGVSLDLTSLEEVGSVYPNLPTTLPSTRNGKNGSEVRPYGNRCDKKYGCFDRFLVSNIYTSIIDRIFPSN